MNGFYKSNFSVICLPQKIGIAVGIRSIYAYCTCTYFSGIHILAELAPNQVR